MFQYHETLGDSPWRSFAAAPAAVAAAGEVEVQGTVEHQAAIGRDFLQRLEENAQIVGASAGRPRSVLRLFRGWFLFMHFLRFVLPQPQLIWASSDVLHSAAFVRCGAFLRCLIFVRICSTTGSPSQAGGRGLLPKLAGSVPKILPHHAEETLSLSRGVALAPRILVGKRP